MQPLYDAVTDMVRSHDSKYLKEAEQVLVGLDGPFVSRRVTPRDLLSGFIGSIVCVEGIVTKCNLAFIVLYLMCRCHAMLLFAYYFMFATYTKVVRTVDTFSNICNYDTNLELNWTTSSTC